MQSQGSSTLHGRWHAGQQLRGSNAGMCSRGHAWAQRTAVLVLAALDNGQVHGLGHVEAHGAGQVADFIAAVVRTRIMFLRARRGSSGRVRLLLLAWPSGWLHAGVATVGVLSLGANEWVRMCALGFLLHIALLTCGLHAADPASTAS